MGPEDALEVSESMQNVTVEVELGRRGTRNIKEMRTHRNALD